MVGSSNTGISDKYPFSRERMLEQLLLSTPAKVCFPSTMNGIRRKQVSVSEGVHDACSDSEDGICAYHRTKYM
jgi:hypothetical protein